MTEIQTDRGIRDWWWLIAILIQELRKAQCWVGGLHRQREWFSVNRREFSHARRGFISKHSARTRTMRAVRCACIVRIVKYLSFAHSWPPPDFPSLEQTAARRMILHRITRWGGEVGSTAGQARVGLHSHRHSPPLPSPLHHHDHHQLLLFLFFIPVNTRGIA